MSELEGTQRPLGVPFFLGWTYRILKGRRDRTLGELFSSLLFNKSKFFFISIYLLKQDLCEFEASLVHRASFMIVYTKNLLSQNNKKGRRREREVEREREKREEREGK